MTNLSSLQLSDFILEEILSYLPVEEYSHLRRVSKEWNAILTTDLDLPLKQDEKYLAKAGKHIKRVIKPKYETAFLKKIVKYCPNLVHLFIFDDATGRELLKLLNARKNPPTKLVDLRISATEAGLYSLELTEDVKKLFVHSNSWARRGESRSMSFSEQDRLRFWSAIPKLESLTVFGLPLNLEGNHGQLFQKLTKLYLCLDLCDMARCDLPAIASLRNVNITLELEEDLDGEYGSASSFSLVRTGCPI